jgi:PhzF family phenazine biosynthesis protein
MKIENYPIYHVDAFTDTLFSGNPAAVCILPIWLPDEMLHCIAKENNCPVTAFLVRHDAIFSIRWITPEYELDLCGHGSLAAAFIIFNYLEPTWQDVSLQSPLHLLKISRNKDLITLNFPAKIIEPCSLPLLNQGLNLQVQESYQYNQERYIAVFNTETEIKALPPDFKILQALEHRGITVTAPGDTVDFVSRTFYPQKMIPEDAVTGAAHCFLVPYWAERLKKNTLQAKQVSARGGDLLCEYVKDRVLLSAKAVLYSQGIIKYSLEK